MELDLRGLVTIQLQEQLIVCHSQVHEVFAICNRHLAAAKNTHDAVERLETLDVVCREQPSRLNLIDQEHIQDIHHPEHVAGEVSDVIGSDHRVFEIEVTHLAPAHVRHCELLCISLRMQK